MPPPEPTLPESRVTLRVTGMTCGTCALRVRKALLEAPGVTEAEVNFATGIARVVRSAGAEDRALVQAVAAAGYGATVSLPARQDLGRREEDERREALGWLLRALAGGAGTVVLLFMHGGQGAWPWLAAALAVLIQIVLGLPFYRGAWRGLKARTGNMDLLVSLGATAGFALAAAGALGWLPGAPVHFDCAPAVLSVVSFGKYLEARARRRAGQAMRGLMEMVPPRAVVIRDGQEREVGVEDVRLGDRVRVPPNAPVPVDGMIISGSSRVDESSMTGEALPVEKKPGDRVIAGTANAEGPLEVRVERVGEETLLAQVMARVEAAQASRASASRLADRVASVLVPVVLAAALAALMAWGLGKGAWDRGWVAATAVLLAACPCALGLAIPAALAVGVGLAARRGVLFRDVEALERAAKVGTVWLDKTGTLTRGRSEVAWAWHPPGEDAQEILRLAASAERHETHPAARAVVRHAEGMPLAEPGRVSLAPGAGISAALPEGEVLVGSPAFLSRQGVDISILAPKLAEAEAQGLGVVCAARGGRAAGLFALRETPRGEAAEALRSLEGMGLAVGMLSGDRPERALALGETLGIPPGRVRAGVLPAAKAEMVKSLSDGGSVAMVGDGVNDAAALASAELGIALGGGASLAKEAAGVTLLGEDLRAVPWTLALARATRRVIAENLVWAFGYNLLAVPLAMAGYLSPWQAAALMALSDLVVIGNALTLSWRVRGVGAPVAPSRDRVRADPAAAERAAWWATCGAGVLAIAKLAAGWATGSLAVMASSLDSLMDTLASGTNACALRWSRREPTRVYAFGYGKVQALAGVLQGGFICASALGLGWAALSRLTKLRHLEELGVGVAVMLATAAASWGLAAYLKRAAIRTGTPLLEADALHYATDLWANAGALAALGLEWLLGWRWVDPLLSVAIAGWVLAGALRVARGAVGELLDHGLPEAEVARVAEVVARYAPEVRGFHDLRTRRSGYRRYFDFHVVIQPGLPFLQAHALTDRIIQDLESLWPGADVTVHADPEPDARLPYAAQG